MQPLVQPSYPVRTDRLRLRPVSLNDLDAIHSYRSMPDVARYLPHEPHSREDTAATLSKMVEQSSLTEPGQWLDLAVEVDGLPDAIGEVLLKLDENNPLLGEVGFVFHPSVQGVGIATEAVTAAVRIAFEQFGWHRVTGICNTLNVRSSGLMERIGMRREASFRAAEWSKGTWSDVSHYAMLREEWQARHGGAVRAGGDASDIDALTKTFLAAFVSGTPERIDLGSLRDLFIPEAVIVKTGGQGPERMSVESFIAPREALLNSGRLLDFSEWEVSSTTEIFGGIAQRWSSSRKKGKLDGEPFTGRFRKGIHFVRLPEGWRISSIVWEDEPA